MARVLITGCSTGFGRAAAIELTARGHDVVATARKVEVLDDLDVAARLALDVDDDQSVTDAVAAAGDIDALVNNAGFGVIGPVEMVPLAEGRRGMETNFFGTVRMIQAVLPGMRARGGGSIVNVTSLAGRVAPPLDGFYSASKFAVEGLSEALHYELAPLGVRVKILEPGGMQTDFGGRSFDFSNDPALAEYQPLVQAVLGGLGPMMANGSPPELIAEAIYAATTDGTDQLRYEAGADAVQLLAARRAADDAAFLGGMRARFGLGA